MGRSFVHLVAILSLWAPALRAGESRAEPLFDTSGAKEAPLADETGDWFSTLFRSPRVDLDAEAIWADGIVLSYLGLASRWESGPAEFGIGYGLNGYAIDYEPNIIGIDREIDRYTHRIMGDGTVSLLNTESFSFVWTGSYYDGFSDYRSLWISEYYRQLFGGVPDYVAPEPEGYFFSGGLRWDYLPRTGSLEVTFGYGRDEIAPAYDVGPDGLERARPPALHEQYFCPARARPEHEDAVAEPLCLYRHDKQRKTLEWPDLAERPAA